MNNIYAYFAIINKNKIKRILLINSTEKLVGPQIWTTFVMVLPINKRRSNFNKTQFNFTFSAFDVSDSIKNLCRLNHKKSIPAQTRCIRKNVNNNMWLTYQLFVLVLCDCLITDLFIWNLVSCEIYNLHSYFFHNSD